MKKVMFAFVAGILFFNIASAQTNKEVKQIKEKGLIVRTVEQTRIKDGKTYALVNGKEYQIVDPKGKTPAIMVGYQKYKMVLKSNKLVVKEFDCQC